jgi:hypothetical protein
LHFPNHVAQFALTAEKVNHHMQVPEIGELMAEAIIQQATIMEDIGDVRTISAAEILVTIFDALGRELVQNWGCDRDRLLSGLRTHLAENPA